MYISDKKHQYTKHIKNQSQFWYVLAVADIWLIFFICFVADMFCILICYVPDMFCHWYVLIWYVLSWFVLFWYFLLWYVLRRYVLYVLNVSHPFINKIRARLRFISFTQLDWTVWRKRFFIYLKFLMLCPKSTLYSCFPAVGSLTL